MKVVRAEIITEQDDQGRWSWGCTCGRVGIGLPDEEAARAQAWLHFERDHVAAAEDDA